MFRKRQGLSWWLLAALCAASTVTLAACGDDAAPEGEDPTPTPEGEPEGEPDPNAEPEPEGEPESVREQVFPVAYVARNRSEIPGIERGGRLMLIASDGSFGPVAISPEGVACHLGCTITEDLDFFLWLEDGGLAATLKAAPITSIEEEGAVIDMNSQVTVSDAVVGFGIGGGRIAYETSDFEVFVGPLPGDNAESVGIVGAAEGTQGGFHLKPDGSQLLAWTVTLTSMTLVRFDLEAGEGPFDLFTFQSTGFGGTGSFYGARERMAWSPDGRFLAVVSTSLVDTNPCQSNDECVMPEICGNNARCTSQRLSINLVDLQSAEKLGRACTSSADCGESHDCDFANPQDPESGRCLPGRLDLGAAGPHECDARQDGEFTDILDTLTWSPDSQTLYLLAAEDCSRFNIPRVAILKTDTRLTTPVPVLENAGADFAVQNCYDAVEDEFTVGATTCVINIAEMQLSKDGNTILFSGSSPAAQNNLELYTIDRLGSRPKRILTEDLETKVEQIVPLKDL